MIGKYFYGALAVAVLIAAASMTTFAQVGELRGHGHDEAGRWPEGSPC